MHIVGSGSATALVIGGSGFIGRELVRVLELNGYTVDVTSSTSSTTTEPMINARGRLFRIKYDSDGFKSVLCNRSYSEIYFMAGNSTPKLSEHDHLLDLNLTNKPFVELLDAVVKESKGSRVWFASSVAVYGENNEDPLSENSECLPLSCYAVSKLMGEEHLKLFHRLYGINGGALRIFSTYGERLKRQLIFDIYRKIKENPNEITLHGTGQEARDLSYVSDQASAILAITQAQSNSGFSVWNVASGDLFSVSDVAEAIINIMGSGTKVNYELPVRSYDGKSWRADISKLKASGFKQQYSLQEGLRKTIYGYDATS